jgi:tetratricopeptide (TPR) repeat protein
MSSEYSDALSDRAARPANHGSQASANVTEIAELASALERAGSWSAAADEYSRLFRASLASGDLTQVVGALRGEARTCRQQERFEEAEELLDLSRQIAERNGLDQEAARAVNSLAALRHLQGDWEGAQELYREAFDAALDCGDDALLAWSSQNLGILANLRGDLQEARLRYMESIAAGVRAGDETSVAIVYNSLGAVCCYLTEWLDALLYFDRGIEIAQRLHHTALLAALHANRAEPLIGLGELNRARHALNSAEIYAATAADSESLAEIARFRGMVAVRAGDLAAAEECFERSMMLLREADLPLEQAGLLEEIAKLRRLQGRHNDALSLLQEARRTYIALDARWNIARAEALLATWQALGESALAAE